MARIAAWLGVACDAALLARVCTLSSFDFMSAEVSIAIVSIAVVIIAIVSIAICP